MRPRFLLVWQKSKNSAPITVCWTPTRQRAVVIAHHVKWLGWFTVIDEDDQKIVEPPFKAS